MKRIEFTVEDRASHPENMEWWKYVRSEFVRQGFDMTKPVTQHYAPNCSKLVFTQED